MGADVSLLPAMQMLAGQPIFLQFINARSDAFLLPLKDSLRAAARDTLVPQLVERVESFLAGYMGISSPPRTNGLSQVAGSAKASFPDVVAARAAGFPATEIADYQFSQLDEINPQPTLLSTPSERQGHNYGAPSSSAGGYQSRHTNNFSDALKSISGWILVTILIGAGWYMLFKVPAVCGAFDLCSKESTSKSKDSKPKKPSQKGGSSGAASTSPTAPPASSSGSPAAPASESTPSAPSRYQPPQPRYIPPPPTYQAPPPAAEESYQPSSSAPLREEPLW